MWYEIVKACVNVGLAWQDQYMSNRINKKLLRTAAKTAEFKAKMTDANYTRRSAYRNEELGQQVWNLAQGAQELMGTQRAAMGATGFDISTGDRRILEDTLRRDLERQEGVNRTYYLQQFEDDIQTQSDILQYNFEAWANRQQVKWYSGIHGLFKIVDAGGRAFVDSAPGLFQGNKKGGISSNTGTDWMKGADTSFSPRASSALGNFSGYGQSTKLDVGYGSTSMLGAGGF